MKHSLLTKFKSCFGMGLCKDEAISHKTSLVSGISDWGNTLWLQVYESYNNEIIMQQITHAKIDKQTGL